MGTDIEQALQEARLFVLHTDLQILDIKQMGDIGGQWRNAALKAIRVWKEWRCRYRQETDVIEILYRGLEGERLRREAVEAVKLYWLIRRDVQIVLLRYINRTAPYREKLQEAA